MFLGSTTGITTTTTWTTTTTTPITTTTTTTIFLGCDSIEINLVYTIICCGAHPWFRKVAQLMSPCLENQSNILKELLMLRLGPSWAIFWQCSPCIMDWIAWPSDITCPNLAPTIFSTFLNIFCWPASQLRGQSAIFLVLASNRSLKVLIPSLTLFREPFLPPC